MRDTEILGVKMSEWPVDELLVLPWHAITHLTPSNKRTIRERGVREGFLKKVKGGYNWVQSAGNKGKGKA